MGGGGGTCGAQWEGFSANLESMPANTVSCHDWQVEESRGRAADFHQRALPDPLTPTVWIHHIESPALVLGSTQGEEILNSANVEAAGIDVCRRRSGGGLVGLDPDNDLWVDVLIPPTSRLWSEDVGKAFIWLGEVWAATLLETWNGNDPVKVHRGPLLDRQAGRLVCFAGLGPGEVTVGGRKVVGLSQRRTRQGARFQCAMTWAWNPVELSRFLDADVLGEAGIKLDDLNIGLPHHDNGDASPSPVTSASAPTRESVIESFLKNLPSP